MNIYMQAINFNAQDTLKEYLEQKLNKLDQFYDRIVAADVYFKLDNNNEKENKIVEIKLEVPGEDIIVKKSGRSFEECIDLATETLKRQIKRKKEKSAQTA